MVAKVKAFGWASSLLLRGTARLGSCCRAHPWPSGPRGFRFFGSGVLGFRLTVHFQTC